MDGIEALSRASQLVGSDAELGRRLGVTGVAIYNMRKRRKISAEMAVAIEHVTQGAVTRAELRPDLFAEVRA